MYYAHTSRFENEIDKGIHMSVTLDELNKRTAIFDRAVQSKDWDTVIKEGKWFLKTFPKDTTKRRMIADAYHERALAFDNEANYKAAISDYTKHLALNPSNEDVQHRRGVAFGMKGNYDMALADLTCVLYLNPNHLTAYYDRGVTFCRMGQYDEGIADFTRAIELDPHSAVLYECRSNAFLSKGLFDESAADYERAVELNPEIKKEDERRFRELRDEEKKRKKRR